MRPLPTHRGIFVALGGLLPLWLTVGRAALGSIGWLTMAMLMLGLPVLVAPLIVALLFFFLPEAREFHHLRPEHAKLLWMMHGLLFSSGFFLVDFGDTEDSAGSVFTVLAGSRFLDLSSFLGLGLGVLGLLALLASLVIAVRAFFRSRRSR